MSFFGRKQMALVELMFLQSTRAMYILKRIPTRVSVLLST